MEDEISMFLVEIHIGWMMMKFLHFLVEMLHMIGR
jgi:hypothetical protein